MRSPLIAAALVAVTPLVAQTQQDFDQVQIRTVPVTDNIYMLQGAGGNIGVIHGPDGTFIVDDQFAPLTDKINAAIAEFAEEPVAWVINTHFHFDHTDGNENFGGAGAVIVSHSKSRERMSIEQTIEAFQQVQEAYSIEGLPKVTFDDAMHFHLNGQTIDMYHFGRAHTDGDAVVHFREANVMHTGDVFVRYGLPFIDQPNGGSMNGMIDFLDGILEVTDSETTFIPGHGALATRDDVVEFRDMLATIRSRVQGMIDDGASFDEILASDPTAGFEGGLPADVWLRLVYDSLTEG